MQTAHAPAPAPADRVTDAAIGAVLAERLVRPLFQPIVDLSSRAVVGLEALARGPAGTTLEFPDRLFAAARAAGRLGELDMLCSERALECALEARVAPPLLFVNAEPAVLDQPLSPHLVDMMLSGLPFRHVLELTERALPAAPGNLLRSVGQVQRWGNSIALDDVGIEPMSLAFLPVLEPEVIKLDMSLLRDPYADHTRTVCAVVRAEARRTGAVVIAEGVETEDDLATARRLGARWGQGWLFGRPGPIDQAVHRFDESAARALRAARPGFHQPAASPFDLASERGQVSAGTADDLAAALARLSHAAGADDATVVLLSWPASTVPAELHELAGLARSVIVLDAPAPAEFVAVALGPGHAYALCGDRRGLVTVDHLPTVAAVTRALLDQHGER